MTLNKSVFTKKVFFLLVMSKLFFGTLISHARSHLNEVPDMLHRAAHFMPEASLNSAIRELKEVIKILEEAKQSYKEQFETNRHHPTPLK